MADREVWERAFAVARRRWARAVVRVTLIDPSVELAYCALALRPTKDGPGAEEACCAFGKTDVEALDALVDEMKPSRATEATR